MFADTSTRRDQTCRSCGAAVPADAHFCPRCSTILPLGRAADYFGFLGVPRKLGLDAGDLERRFRTLSRQFHPDYYCNAPAAERRASLERSSYLNDAYRTLKDPVARAEYLLTLAGARPRADGALERSHGGSARVPVTLLQDVFDLNEELDAIRDLRAGGAERSVWQPRLDAARRPIEAKRDEHEMQLRLLSERWDALVDGAVSDDDPRAREVLESLGERLLERNYIANLLANLEP